jgi:glycosyltransferase involved in cell wall biosynthesis
MRIAYVYDAVHPWQTGGVQRRVHELSRRLADEHDVHWYGLKYWDGPETREREGVTLHGVIDAVDLYVERHDRRSITEALRFGASLIGPLLRDEYDVIDCQAFPYFSAFPSKLQSVVHDTTFLMTWHEVWGAYWHEYLGKLGVCGNLVEQTVSRLPDLSLSVSDRTRRDLQRLGVSDVRVVPNGISMEEVATAPEATQPVDIFYAGRLTPYKNVDLLLEAVARLAEGDPEIVCVIVGDGPRRSTLESLTSTLGIDSNVRFLGFLDEYERVLGYMKAAEAFVLPSQREGFGISVLESLACGTPSVTVAYPRNAAVELVEDGSTGVVCEPTPSALARSIRTARAELSSADCIASGRRYRWDRIADQMEQVYRSAVKGREAPSAPHRPSKS